MDEPEEAMIQQVVTTKATHARTVTHSELRFTTGAGGPGEMEVIVKADEQHVEIAVWNPWRNEWATIQLTGTRQ